MRVAEIQDWVQGLEEIRDLIGEEFARTKPRNNAVGYIQGLLSDEERKNSWNLSERHGQTTPDGKQRLLSTTDWDPDAVRDALFGYVKKQLGHPEGILAIDETGFLKKGTASAGVARQYSGTAVRVENCQIGVFFSYATPGGRTLVDRELYLPKSWMDDPLRCRRAGIPEDRQIATKPVLAADMVERALDAGIQAELITGDAVYGKHFGLRRRLQARDMHYVMAVPVNHQVIITTPGSLGTEGRAAKLFRAWTDGPGAPAPRVLAPREAGCMRGPGSKSTDPLTPANIGCWPADHCVCSTISRPKEQGNPASSPQPVCVVGGDLSVQQILIDRYRPAHLGNLTLLY
jgi:SRSO17 transposase